MDDDEQEEGGHFNLPIKKRGAIVAVVTLLAGFVLVMAFVFIKNRGGLQVADIVASSVRSEHVTTSGDGSKVLSDKVLVMMRPEAYASIGTLAGQIGVKVDGSTAADPNTYVVSFPQATGYQLRKIIDQFRQSPDVLDAQMISAE